MGCGVGCLQLALEIFNEMKTKKLPVTVRALNSVLKTYTNARHLRRAVEVFDSLYKEHNLVPDERSYNALFTYAPHPSPCFALQLMP